MRLHVLTLTAFGPFAETVRVDFDALFESNVFLLCGDTGAGKSTVLDAVCFALFGDVPGDRGAARQLRSQHAAPGTAPQVVLELEIAGRRLRFTRSPAWQRPKKRGAGLTTEPARVLVEERSGDSAWATRSTRLDEAGHLVGDLVGMTLEQFSQVVLLPQGGFDTFLRATSEDRQRVLTRLFRTRRFEDVERWLVERRTTLRRTSQTHHEAINALLHRTSETAEVELPAWELERAARDGEVARWVDDLRTSVVERCAEVDAVLQRAERRLASAAEEVDAGLRLADLRARHAAAVRDTGRLDQERALISTDEARLDAATRAEAVLPLLRHLDRAEAASARASEAASQVVAEAVAMVDDLAHVECQGAGVDGDALAEHARLATARAVMAREFAPRARELAGATEAITVAARDIEAAERERDVLTRRIDHAPHEWTALVEERERLRLAASDLQPAQARASELGRLLAQLAVAEELDFQVVESRRRHDEQRRVTLELRERLHDLRERRLAGMAAELASAMAVGADCPVCGSHEHPAPATAAAGAPTGADEEQLRARIDDEEMALLVLADTRRGYQARLVVVRDTIGTATMSDTSISLDDAQERVQQARVAVAAEPAADQRLEAHRTAEREDATALAGVEVRLAEAGARRASAQEQLARTSAELTAILDRSRRSGRAGTRGAVRADLSDLSDPEGLAELGRAMSQLAAENERSARLLLDARDALAERHRAETAAATARDEASEAAGERGFADIDAAACAALDVETCRELRDEVVRWRRLDDEVARVLADPEVAAAAAGPAPEVEAMTRARDEASRVHGSAAAAARLAARQERRVSARTRELAAALQAWEPVRAEYDRVRSLSELAEGRGSDNARQMRLSAYVLAARLSQVVAAANERLLRMSDERFLLEHVAERGVGERRGGLSLTVRDQWTDESRDPVTLSGGETFVVSLALALGLADVVTGEAGGTRIDTLFVDEGFGSLDADTLELVMDTVDSLRDGGRVVGLVSHVAELRTRIPAQLVVTKTRTGSTLEQRVGVG